MATADARTRRGRPKVKKGDLLNAVLSQAADWAGPRVRQWLGKLAEDERADRPARGPRRA